MPKWDLACQTCGTEFEFFKLRSDETAECPKCGEKDAKNLPKLPSKGVDYIPKGPNWMKRGRSGY